MHLWWGPGLSRSVPKVSLRGDPDPASVVLEEEVGLLQTHWVNTGAFAHLGLRDSRRYLLLREVGGSLIQEAHDLGSCPCWAARNVNYTWSPWRAVKRFCQGGVCWQLSLVPLLQQRRLAWHRLIWSDALHQPVLAGLLDHLRMLVG